MSRHELVQSCVKALNVPENVVVLRGIREELLEELEEGTEDKAAIQARLNKELHYLALPAAAKALNVAAWRERADRTAMSHDGGGTSLSYKLHTVWEDGAKEAGKLLKAGKAPASLCTLLDLTLAMKSDEMWYLDTDVPEVASPCRVC